ncbi:MAG: pyridoxal phosphate-dependent aminotransferase, partial [bacterium]
MAQIISRAMHDSIESSSWIRRMFDEGVRLKQEHGPENVCDLALGNPILEPPAAFHESLHRLLHEGPPGSHRYGPNAGLPDVREFLAAELSAETGLAYSGAHLVVTTGAAGAINVLLKAILDPGDEVVTLCPYFVEYDFYAANHGGVLVRAETDDRFQPDLEALERVITPRTRALIVNSPNNPTGAVYPEAALRGVADVLRAASQKHGRPILLISDEPYRRVVFDGLEVPWIPPLYDHTLVVTSYSKDLGLAGERIGYVAASPRIEGWEALVEAMVLANRVLGFVHAP